MTARSMKRCGLNETPRELVGRTHEDAGVESTGELDDTVGVCRLITRFGLLKPQEVADMIGVAVSTLATWRCTKRYRLPYLKIGKNVMYAPKDIENFIRDNYNDVA